MTRIVATSDTHFGFSPDQIPDGDVFIHAGDLMYTGAPNEWTSRLESLRALPHKRKIFVPGNHDYHIQNYQGISTAELRRAGVELVGLNQPLVDVEGHRLLGVPYVTGLPGWAFNVEEEWLYEHLCRATENDRPDIVVSHAPMYGTLDAVHPEEGTFSKQIHVGGLATNRWFNGLEEKPKVWIHGHIHESYGRTTVDGCTFYNVALCDRDYEQTNKAAVIDL